MSRTLGVIVVGFLALTAAPAGGFAQDPASAAPTAVSLAGEGKARYDRGEWAEALALFEAAEQLAHSPVIVLYIARSQRNLGRLVAARQSFVRVSQEELPAGAPEPFVVAKADAAEDLQSLEPRIPMIELRLGEIPTDAQIEVDEAPLSAADRDKPILVDPGEHRVRAVRGGVEIASATVTLAEGQRETVTLRSASVAGPPQPPPGGTPPDQPSDSSGSLVPGLVVVGIGAVGLGAGIVTRVMAFQKVDDVEDRCVDGHCLVSDEAEIDAATTLQTVSTICLVAGGAAVAAGIVLLAVAPGGDGPTVSVRAGPLGISATGSF
jgi:hypothetical protein